MTPPPTLKRLPQPGDKVELSKEDIDRYAMVHFREMEARGSAPPERQKVGMVAEQAQATLCGCLPEWDEHKISLYGNGWGPLFDFYGPNREKRDTKARTNRHSKKNVSVHNGMKGADFIDAWTVELNKDGSATMTFERSISKAEFERIASKPSPGAEYKLCPCGPVELFSFEKGR